MSGALLLPGAPQTPPRRVTVEDLRLGYQTAIKRRGEPHYSCRWQLYYGPITAVPYRAPSKPLPRASILFRPLGDSWAQVPRPVTMATRVGGGAGYCPRVRCAYSTSPFCAKAGKPASLI